MNRFLLSYLLGSAAVLLLAASGAQAQAVAPDFPAQPGTPAPARAAKLPVDAARVRRQQQMSPEDAARDQQLQIMEARTGNTSFGMARGAARPQDKANGGFTVLKFKQLRGQEEKRGETRRVLMGAHTTGEPLNRKKKHKFLFF